MARASNTTAAPTVRDAAAVLSTLSNAIPVTAKAKVARKTPKAVLVTFDRTNVRMTRGESCELASWSPTRVIAKTTPTKVSMEDAITCSIVFAVRIRTTWPRSQSVGRPSRSGRETTTAMSTPASTRATGIDQNRSRTHSLRRTRRYSQEVPTGSARTCPRRCHHVERGGLGQWIFLRADDRQQHGDHERHHDRDHDLGGHRDSRRCPAAVCPTTSRSGAAAASPHTWRRYRPRSPARSSCPAGRSWRCRGRRR